jgi:2-polyprenyl-3-methyl-5-hydroxy-6-metoxy-1,4-benzoquinol methylase
METRANEFDERVGRLQMLEAIELSVGKSVLELGCGSGQFTPMLYERFDRVVGLDASEENIALARKTTLDNRHSFFVAKAEDFQIDEKFDTILMTMLLEHVDSPVAVLKNAKSLLKSDGRIIIQVPNANSFNRQLAKYMGLIQDLHELPKEQIEKYGHKRVYDIKMLIKDIEGAGLVPIHRTGIVLKPFTNAQMQLICNGHEEKWRCRFVDALAKIGERFPLECAIICVVAVKPERKGYDKIPQDA